MIAKIKHVIFTALSCAAILNAAGSQQKQTAKPLDMLKANGTLFADSSGNTVVLKGCNLGNWFAMEMWMMHLYDDEITDHYGFEQNLEKRFGLQQKQRLMEMFRANWITERDFAIIKSFGMNCVRLPFLYSLLEDEKNPMTLKPDAFKWLDYAVDTAEKYGLYTILCLHGAAGGQSNMGHCGRENQNLLWSSKSNRQRTCWLWQQIALHYKNRSCVAGFDCLNEPWGADMPEQNRMFDSIYKAIRIVNKEHILFLQGHGSVEGLWMPQKRGWQNVAYSAHCYPGIFDGGRPTVQTQVRFLKLYLKKMKQELEKYNVPFLMGEFNVLYASAGGTEMMRRHFDIYADSGWAATMWAYKVLTIPGEERRGFWEMVTNKEPLPNIDFKTADIPEIEAYFRFLSSEPDIYQELKQSLTQNTPPAPLPEPEPMPEPIKSAPANDKIDGFTATDIGDIIAGGQKIYPDGKIDIYGSGADIYLSNDEFRFIWQKIDGDFEISATVNELSFTHMFAKAGIMIRSDLSDNAVCALFCARPAGELEFIHRHKKGKYVKTDGHLGHDFPGINLKLVRDGNKITSWHSKGGRQPEQFITTELASLPQTVYVGLFCLSHDDSQLAKASFTNISIKNTKIDSSSID